MNIALQLGNSVSFLGSFPIDYSWIKFFGTKYVTLFSNHCNSWKPESTVATTRQATRQWSATKSRKMNLTVLDPKLLGTNIVSTWIKLAQLLFCNVSVTVEAKRLCKNVQRLNRAAYHKMTACRVFTMDGRLPQKFISLILEYTLVILQFAMLSYLKKNKLNDS